MKKASVPFRFGISFDQSVEVGKLGNGIHRFDNLTFSLQVTKTVMMTPTISNFMSQVQKQDSCDFRCMSLSWGLLGPLAWAGSTTNFGFDSAHNQDI